MHLDFVLEQRRTHLEGISYLEHADCESEAISVGNHLRFVAEIAEPKDHNNSPVWKGIF